MSRTKTKRIVWTMAVLLALSFVAAMVLHRHEEPRIIGNISKEEASQISRAAIRGARAELKSLIRYQLKSWNIKGIIELGRLYYEVRVLTIKREEGGSVYVTMGFGNKKEMKNNEETLPFLVEKSEGEWRLVIMHD